MACLSSRTVTISIAQASSWQNPRRVTEEDARREKAGTLPTPPHVRNHRCSRTVTISIAGGSRSKRVSAIIQTIRIGRAQLALRFSLAFAGLEFRRPLRRHLHLPLHCRVCNASDDSAQPRNKQRRISFISFPSAVARRAKKNSY